jgi:hypothetical protein
MSAGTASEGRTVPDAGAGEDPRAGAGGAGAGDSVATVTAVPVEAIARRAAASAAAAGAATPPSAQISQQVAAATLRDEEAHTAAAMIRVGRLVAVACLATLPFLGGDSTLRIAMAVAIVPAVGIGYWVERRIRTVDGYGEAAMIILAAAVAPAALIGVAYFGIFSGAQLFPALALYFFSRRERFASALAFYLPTPSRRGRWPSRSSRDPSPIRGSSIPSYRCATWCSATC